MIQPISSSIIAYSVINIFSQNTEAALEILKSEIEPRHLILQTARKFTEAEVDQVAGKQMQNAFGEYLNGLDHQIDLTTSSQESSQIDERYLFVWWRQRVDISVWFMFYEFQIGDFEPKISLH